MIYNNQSTESLLGRLIKNTDALDLFSGVGLLSADIRENVQGSNYYPFAPKGACTIIAHDEADIMEGFAKHVCKVVYFGKDLEHYRRMKASAELQSEVLIYTRQPITFDTDGEEEPPRYCGRMIPRGMEFDEAATDIATMIDTRGAKVVIVDDLSTFAAKNDCGQIVARLNDIARAKDVVMLAGFNFAANTTATEQAAPYFAQHDRELCFLIPGEENGTKYFAFMYGQPERKTVIYALDKQGNVCIPAEMSMRLKLKELLPMLLKGTIKQPHFVKMLFGAFHGQYVESTINTIISEADKWGMIRKSKKNGNVYISIGGDEAEQTDSKNVAITAKTDRHKDRKHTAARVPLIHFGGCKIVAVRDEEGINNQKRDKYILREFCKCIVEAVMKGKRLDFKTDTDRQRLMITAIAPKDEATGLFDWVASKAEKSSYQGQISCLHIEPKTSDSAFMEALERETQKNKPDFAFVFGLNNLDTASLALLADDLKQYSKRNDIACIAELYHYTTPEAGLTDKDTLCTIGTMYDETFEDVQQQAGGRNVPDVYEFSTATKGRIFLCRFVRNYKDISAIDSETQKRALVISLLRFADETPIERIRERITNLNLLSWAEANGLIKLTGKKPNQLVTFCKY